LTLRFAFLVLEEHPYGREMLRILLERGFRPGLVIEEASPVADEERAKFLARAAGQSLPPTMREMVEGGGMAHGQVGDHNDLDCQRMLQTFGPELVVLGGTRILRPPLLSIPSRGTLNAHPGLLPRLRGSSSVGWALYKDLPMGCTVHLLDAGIDTGPIVLKRGLPVYRGDSYEELVRRMFTLAGELMAGALALFEAGPVEGDSQDRAAGETLQVIPPELLQEGKARLAGGRYSHYADGEDEDGGRSL
jgi:folate-dependent phosphoribosylglycinamide formyltransferase PurN